MNWLAHVLLSEPSPAFRIGNLLPDLLPRTAVATISPAFQRGMSCHRRIDAFTDSHPVVRHSVQRISAPHRRFAGILVDVFYDHFLSAEWERHCAQPLAEFVAEFYDSFAAHPSELPAETFGILQRMRVENWLGCYQDLAGVELTLARIGRRLRRPIHLGMAVVELEAQYELLRSDFEEFFPQLRAHLESDPVQPG
jgi:acyl carrier protein phosphodiesterase